MKALKHTAEGCQTCSDQIKSVPNDKILRRINIPEIHHYNIACGVCNCESIIGNVFRCFTCKDFVACEPCSDAGIHEHSMIYVSSK